MVLHGTPLYHKGPTYFLKDILLVLIIAYIHHVLRAGSVVCMAAVRRLNSKLVGTSGGHPRHILPYLSHPPSSRRFSFRIEWCIGFWHNGQSVETTGCECKNIHDFEPRCQVESRFELRVVFLDVFRLFFLIPGRNPLLFFLFVFFLLLRL